MDSPKRRIQGAVEVGATFEAGEIMANRTIRTTIVLDRDLVEAGLEKRHTTP